MPIAILVFVLLVSGLTAIPAAAIGLGVSPPTITIENAIPGQDYIEMIAVYSSATSDGIFSLTGSGDMADWVTFYTMDNDTQPITEIMIPTNGMSYANVKFTIPQDASPQIYIGQLLLTSALLPTAITGGSGAQVQLQMPINVTIRMQGAPALNGAMNLMSFNYSGTPQLGTITKLDAIVQNLTPSAAKAYLSAEVYLNDNLVDTIKGDELLIPIGNNKTITAYYKPTQAGDYTIKGHVIYEGNETDALTIQMTVGSGTTTGGSQIAAGGGTAAGGSHNLALIGGVGGAVVLIAAGATLFIFVRRRRSPGH